MAGSLKNTNGKKSRSLLLVTTIVFTVTTFYVKADNGYESQGVQYTTPTYGNKKAEEAEKTEEELLTEKLFTPRDEFQLPERLSEYEQPEFLSEEAGAELNAGIPSVIQSVYKRKSNKEDLTSELGANLENTTPIEDVIDLNQYLDMDNLNKQKKNEELAERYKNKEVTKEELEQELEEMVFPVTTELLPTRMPSARMELNPEAKSAVVTPMVFIGMDEYSLSWLKLNIEEIKKYSPPIFVTQVDSLADLQQLKRMIPELKLVPVKSDEVLKTYGVDFYPVMVTRDGIFQ